MAPPKQDIEDPTRANCRRESAEPSATLSRIETVPPPRIEERNDNVLPICAYPNTLIFRVEPNLATPVTETPDPTRAKERTESEEPIPIKLKMETAEPNRPADRIDIELPNETESSTLHLDPK